MQLLVDSDALLHTRKLSLLQLLLEQPVASLHMAGFAARHECVALQADVRNWESLLLLAVHDVVVGSVAYKKYQEFRREIDKGEAEAVAWALGEADCPTFVSCDGRARRFAAQKGLAVWHLGDLARWLVADAKVPLDLIAAKLATWDDPSQQVGRPPDWPGLSAWRDGSRHGTG